MAERSSFFGSVNRDRVYYAADWALHLSKYFTNGIFNNDLQVIVKDGMRIAVKIGDANINGYRYTNDSEKVIEVTNADGVLDRIDNIVVRLDLPNRQITTEIVTGSFSENAIAPTITRGSSIYELRIAKISIPAGTTEITEDLITDTRFNNNDCGNVICAVKTPDFTDILKQYTALWDKFITSCTNDFDKWIGELKETLSGDVAANLLTLIQKVEKEKADIPRSKTITLLADNWVLNEATEKYEYTYTDNTITENDYANIDLINRGQADMLATIDADTYSGYIKFVNDDEVTEDVVLQIVLFRVKPETGGETENESNV